MNIYVAQARFHMKFGTTARQIAAVAAKNHNYSVRNPLARHRFPMTVDEVLADKMVIWPITRAIYAPMSDGADAMSVASHSFVKKHGLGSLADGIRGIGASSRSRTADQFQRQLTNAAADSAYAMAGRGPKDVDIAVLNDASANAEILHSENARFCDYGTSGALARGLALLDCFTRQDTGRGNADLAVRTDLKTAQYRG